jgi:hypothetical protein
MNNNSIRIDSYLQNEMSVEERAAFENILLTDPELKYELEVQRSITQAAYNAGIKHTFGKAIRKRIMTARLIRWSIIVLTGTVLLYIFRESIFPGTTAGNENIAQQNNSALFIHPPLKNINVPFDEYDVNADTGDTLFTPSGSVIFFPQSAFTDESGNLIKGEVKIRFREFAEPIDFFISGITMAYDSAGTKYNFESSGMCEIHAYQNSKALFVNPAAKPEVFLSAVNKSPLHNLYFLDTVKRSWTFVGKDTITEVKNLVRVAADSASPGYANTEDYPGEGIGIPVKPLRPLKASGDHQSFSIEVDPGSFEELMSYDKLKFEVIDESTYRRSDADEHWDNVKLDRGMAKGVYTVTFTNTTRKVSYKVRPVLEGEDYAASMKTFTEKSKAYKEALQRRLAREKDKSDSVNTLILEHDKKMLALKKENDRINAVIIARNKNMQQLQLQLAQSMEKLAAAEEKVAMETLLKIQKNKSKFDKDLEYSTEIVRSFSINQFGIWNCDHPQYPNMEVPLIASYADISSKSLMLSSVAVVYKNVNGITQYDPRMQIRFMPKADNMVWGIRDSTFFYFTYSDFRNAGLRSESKAFTFKMRQAKERISSYEEIKALVEKL